MYPQDGIPSVTQTLNEFQKTNEHEWFRIDELIRLLEPIEEATVQWSGRSYATISLVHPMVNAIISFLTEFKSTSNTITSVVNNILSDIQVRFGKPNQLELISTILDPRWKSLSFCSERAEK